MPPRTRRSIEVRQSGGPSFRRRVRRCVRGARGPRDCRTDLPGQWPAVSVTQCRMPETTDTSQSADASSQPTGQTNGPTVWVSVFLGAAIALSVAGLAARIQALFAEQHLFPPQQVNVFWSDMVTRGVAGAALMILALGVRVPQRLAIWVCALAWRRFLSRGRPSDVSGVLLNHTGVDRPLYWVVLSVIALAAGIAIALLPLNVRLAGAAYQWMTIHFLWSVGSLALLQAATVIAIGLIPLTLLGLAMSCAHHLSCRYGRWETRATAWLLVGAAAGTFSSMWIARFTGRADLVLIVAALPALLVSLVSAASSSSRARRSPGDREPKLEACAYTLPIYSDRWPTLLRASIVVVAAGGACAIAIGTGSVSESAGNVDVSMSAMLLAMGIGVLAGCRAKHSGPRSIGGFGVACSLAGLSVAISTIGHTSGILIGPGSAGALVYLSLAAIGFATAYGRQALLHRVASRSSAGATILARMLVGAALMVWVGAPLAERIVGKPATLLILALFLLALGGTLIIHEPSYSPRTRGVRLCAVFGSIATMILLSLSPLG